MTPQKVFHSSFFVWFEKIKLEITFVLVCADVILWLEKWVFHLNINVLQVTYFHSFVQFYWLHSRIYYLNGHPLSFGQNKNSANQDTSSSQTPAIHLY